MPNFYVPNELRSAEGLLLTLLLFLIFRIETLPNEPTGIRIKREDVFERSEFVFPPECQLAHLGTRPTGGQWLCVAFLCLLSLAKQRK